jgi:hypothetical protein
VIGRVNAFECINVITTPVENMADAKAILENDISLVALDLVVKLMSKALMQQERPTISHRLASDAVMCKSSTATKTQGRSPDNCI